MQDSCFCRRLLKARDEGPLYGTAEWALVQLVLRQLQSRSWEYTTDERGGLARFFACSCSSLSGIKKD